MEKCAPATVDEYMARVTPDDARKTLAILRGWIREAVPEADELISYGIPSYKFHGYVASIAAFKNHCSFFPGHTVADFATELSGYKVSKGTVQFPHDKPLSEALVKAIVRARADENLAASTK